MLLLFAHERDADGRPKLPDPFAGPMPDPREMFERFLFLNGLHRLPEGVKAGMWRAEVERRAAKAKGKKAKGGDRGRTDRSRFERPDRGDRVAPPGGE